MAETEEPKRRVVVLVRRGSEGGGADGEAAEPGGRLKLLIAAACLLIAVGLAIGYRGAGMLGVETPSDLATRPGLTERVQGGLYALELAMPQGKARWMLEFDAEIVTKDGPTNPLELRNALEKLVIDATSMPIVQTATAPEAEMRAAMLAIAAQDFPWLVDIYMTRSDLRANISTLGEIGAAMRGER